MSRRKIGGFVRAEAGASMKPFLKSYGIEDPDALIRESGIDPDKLGDYHTLFRLHFWADMAERAAARTGDPCFGFKFAIQLPIKDLGVLAYVMFNSPTLGRALTAMSRFYATQQTLGKVSLGTGGREARLSYSLYDPSVGPGDQIKDAVLAFAVRFCREATGQPDWKPLRLHLERAAPAGTSCHEEYLGARVEYSSHENALVFRVEDLDIPLKKADPGLLPVLQRHAEHLLKTMPVPGDVAEQVRRSLTQMLGTGDFDIEVVAKQLELSPRTLQQRLSEAGTSFREVLADTRTALAKRYLKDPSLYLTEIAFLLGYSELSAFTRAFTRSTGKSPKEWRREKD